jgi:hypothetical protein
LELRFYYYFLGFSALFFSWLVDHGVIYIGISTAVLVWVDGVYFILITVKSMTRSPSNSRPYPCGSAY